MTDRERGHRDPRVMDLEEAIATDAGDAAKAAKINRDSWRRWWGGLSYADQQTVISVTQSDGFKGPNA